MAVPGVLRQTDRLTASLATALIHPLSVTGTGASLPGAGAGTAASRPGNLVRAGDPEARQVSLGSAWVPSALGSHTATQPHHVAVGSAAHRVRTQTP